MKQPETKFKERVQKDLNELRNIWFVKIQQVSIRGIPDFLVCANGYFIGLELKKDEDTPRNKLQEWTLKAISIAGGMSFVACPENWSDTLATIENMTCDNHDDDGDWEITH